MASKRPRQDEAKTEEDDWTKRPPYAPEDDKPRVAKYTGSCHCHDVTYELYADPKDAHYCHCDVCQKLHGAPAHWSAVMEKSQVLFTCSPDKLSFYRTEDQSTEYKLPLKLSCKRCHGPICDEGRNMMLMYPSTVDFKKNEDREPFTPRRHIFYKMRCVDVHDDMPKWEGMVDKSERMDEDAHGQKGVTGTGSRHGDEDKGNKK